PVEGFPQQPLPIPDLGPFDLAGSHENVEIRLDRLTIRRISSIAVVDDEVDPRPLTAPGKASDRRERSLGFGPFDVVSGKGLAKVNQGRPVIVGPGAVILVDSGSGVGLRRQYELMQSRPEERKHFNTELRM